MPRKKNSKAKSSSASGASSARSVNKSAFVRALPATMSALDVIAKAKAAGFTLSKAQVYTIRTNARAQEKKGGRRRPGRPPAAAAPAARASRSVEAQFAELAVDLGFARAQELLERLRHAAQGLLR